MDVVDLHLSAGVRVEAHAGLQLPQFLVLELERHFEGAVEEPPLLGKDYLAVGSRFHVLVECDLHFDLVILSERPALNCFSCTTLSILL